MSVPARGDWSRPSRRPLRVRGCPAIVTLAGGGVAVSQAVAAARRAGRCPRARAPRRPHGSSPAARPPGRTRCSCRCSTRPRRPSWSTSASSPRRASCIPINFQGIVLQPGQVRSENVGAVVQDLGTRQHHGRRPGPAVWWPPRSRCSRAHRSGLSLVPGTPARRAQWSSPRARRRRADRRRSTSSTRAGRRSGHGAPAPAARARWPRSGTRWPRAPPGPADEHADPHPRRRPYSARHRRQRGSRGGGRPGRGGTGHRPVAPGRPGQRRRRASTSSPSGAGSSPRRAARPRSRRQRGQPESLAFMNTSSSDRALQRVRRHGHRATPSW